MCKDHDLSSISGSEDEEERDNSLAEFRQHEMGGVFKSKLFIQLQNGDKVAVWRCFLLDESEIISFENDKSLFIDKVGNALYLKQTEVIDKLRYLIHEPRDNTRLRIVLMARGGHFAGCVFDGNSLVAHKTFHRSVPHFLVYVIFLAFCDLYIGLNRTNELLLQSYFLTSDK